MHCFIVIFKSGPKLDTCALSPEFLRLTQRCILKCVSASLGEFIPTFLREVPSSRKNAFFLEIKVDEEYVLPGD